MRLAERVAKLAAEVMDLACLLNEEIDIACDLIDALDAKDLRLTHGGHQVLRDAGIRITGADGLSAEDVLVRRGTGVIELEPEQMSKWTSIQLPVPFGKDILMSLDLDITSQGGAVAFVRSRMPSQEPLDGPRVRVGNGRVSMQGFLRAPLSVGPDSAGAHLCLVVNGLSRLVIKKIGVVYLDH